MSEKRIVANNIFYLTLAEVLGRIFQFFYYKHITVALGTDAFGVFSWSVTNVTYFFIVVGAGLDIYGIREITKDKSKLKYYSDVILSLRLLLAILAFALLCFYAFMIPKSYEIKLVLVISGIRLFGDALLPNWVYQAVEKMQVVAIRNFAFNIINFILAYILVSNAGDIYYASYSINLFISLPITLVFQLTIQQSNY
jgi:O-antigen/teichoic acid export membrane protein